MTNIGEIVNIYIELEKKVGLEQIKALQEDLIRKLIKYRDENGLEDLKKIEVYEWLKKVEKNPSPSSYDIEIELLKEKIIKENADKQKKPIVEIFEAENWYSISGAENKLSWNVKHATTLILFDDNNKPIPHSDGYTYIRPLTISNEREERKYRLLIENNNGMDEKQITIVVFPVPILEIVKSTFPSLESNIKLNLDVSIPSFNITETLDIILDKVIYYPEVIKLTYNYDLINTKHRSPFNIYFFYERIQKFFKRGGRFKI